MLKIFPELLAIPLHLIFNRCLAEGYFPLSWKKANVQPVHKKNSRQLKSNYRPISLLPICSKIFEKVLFDQIYTFLNSNNLISNNQSGFRPRDSTINQLLSITHEIYESFENHHETRAIFLDISKAFDKVWHDGLLFKLACNGISGNLHNLISSFLSNREQRVVLNGTVSDFLQLKSGVPQGSVLGPLLFLVYINDLTENIISTMKLFADDSSLFTCVHNVNDSHVNLTHDLDTITAWAYQWKMEFNPDITKQAIEVIFSHKRNKPIHPQISFNGIPVKRENYTNHIGLYLDTRLSFRKHIDEKIKTANKAIGLLTFLSKYSNRRVLDQLYKLYVRPHLDNGDMIYHNQNSESAALIESVQYKGALIVSGCWKGTNRTKLYEELGWESLSDRRHARRMCLYFKILHDMTPIYLKDHSQNCQVGHTLRFKNSFFPYCKVHWNDLPNRTKQLTSLAKFKNIIVSSTRPIGKPYYDVSDKIGLKYITQLRVGLNDLRENRHRHGFVNCPSPICSCLREPESTSHFLLRCPKFTQARMSLRHKLRSLNDSNLILSLAPSDLTNLLIYGSKSLKKEENKFILESSIAFIKESKRFDKPEAFS